MSSLANYLIIELKDLHDTPLSPSVVRAAKLFSELQEAAGERFDRLLELRLVEVEDVGKMLAKDLEPDSEPCCIKGRTFSKSFVFVSDELSPKSRYDLASLVHVRTVLLSKLLQHHPFLTRNL